MKTKLIALFIAVFALIAMPLSASAEGMRVYSNAYRPYRLLTKQFASNANVFTIVDPSPAGTPLTLANATGLAPEDGVVTLGFEAGFTAPLTVTAYYWQADAGGLGTACYVRASNIAASYSQSVDTNYASVSFSLPAQVPFIILTSGAVTGNVYCSAPAYSANNNTAVGY